MIVRELNDIVGTDREVSGPTWTSRRLLLAGDGLNFSMHDTVLRAGTTTHMHYKNHVEAVYCVEGTGSILNKATGEVHAIEPGVIYCLNDKVNDAHALTADTDLRMICVFDPPLVGSETHGEDGAYPLLSVEDSRASA